MSKEIKTSIVINATTHKVWQVLTNLSDYQNWNPFIVNAQGKLIEGEQLELTFKPTAKKTMTFKPTLLSIKPNKELRWLGKLLFKGLFDGEHKFELIANKDNSTTLLHSEKFTGILLGMLNMDETKSSFERMNLKLKEVAEKA
jgi:hypothetical protein